MLCAGVSGTRSGGDAFVGAAVRASAHDDLIARRQRLEVGQRRDHRRSLANRSELHRGGRLARQQRPAAGGKLASSVGAKDATATGRGSGSSASWRREESIGANAASRRRASAMTANGDQQAAGATCARPASRRAGGGAGAGGVGDARGRRGAVAAADEVAPAACAGRWRARRRAGAFAGFARLCRLPLGLCRASSRATCPEPSEPISGQTRYWLHPAAANT